MLRDLADERWPITAALNSLTAVAKQLGDGDAQRGQEAAIHAASGTASIVYLQHTEPGGCWVAELDGEIIGTAVGLIRELLATGRRRPGSSPVSARERRGGGAAGGASR